MKPWQVQPVGFRFQLSDWVLFSRDLPMHVCAHSLIDAIEPVERPVLPDVELDSRSQGYAIRNLPITQEQPKIRQLGEYLCYVPLQYPHCYIDLGWDYEQYLQKFSSKTRSTIRRKVRKFEKHCGGTIEWRCYTEPEEVNEFFTLARRVSQLTYQERLLEAGLPESPEFIDQAVSLAKEGRLRAFILFDGARPVSYLYCPARGDVLVYAYLGYDPEYQALSVGTVLQWLAMEKLFGEKRFRYFDFTEGLSAHKQLFATHQQLCANVFFVKRTFRSIILIHAHNTTNLMSKSIGNLLERHNLKSKLRKVLRGI